MRRLVRALQKARAAAEEEVAVLEASEAALSGALERRHRATLAAIPRVWHEQPVSEEIEEWLEALIVAEAKTRRIDMRIEQLAGLVNGARAITRSDGPLKGKAQLPSLELPLPVAELTFAHMAQRLYAFMKEVREKVEAKEEAA